MAFVRSDSRRLFIYGPYTPAAKVESNDIRRVRRLAKEVEVRDDVNLLVFQFVDTKPDAMLVPRSKVDFAAHAKGRKIVLSAERLIVDSARSITAAGVR